MFEPEEVVRDKEGFWLHSVFTQDEEVDITTLPVSEGMEFRFIDFFDDASRELQDRYDAAGLLRAGTEGWRDVIRDWQPKTPGGDGWFLAGLYDTEDGPQACFVRKQRNT